MPRREYLNLRLTTLNRPLIAALCRRIGRDPREHSAQVDAVNFALAYAVAELGLAEAGDAQGDETGG